MSEKGLSRRDFLVSAGSFAASALASGGVLGAASPAMAAAPALPWPYVTLDPSAVMQTAYNNYYVGGCMYATGAALISALATAVGAPWDTFNPDLFKYGGGGISSWGTLCGALNGACAFIQMVTPSSAQNIIHELMGWYCGYPFPTTRMDTYARYAVNQPISIAKSPLCHNSSGTWAFDNGFRIGSNERKDRCAKLSGDVAYQVIYYLNAWKAGNFTPTLTAPTYQADNSAYIRCFNCHEGPTSTKDMVRGKMNCMMGGCHPDKVTHHING